MGRNKNDRQRSDYIHAVAAALVDKRQYDSLPLAARKSLRVMWQHQLSERVGCTLKTARSHIRKVLFP